MEKIEVTKNDVGKRLDLFITVHQKEFSRSHIKKFLDMGKVKVNGEIEYRPNYKVNLQDVVEVESSDDMGKKYIKPVNIPIDIVYIDENIVIADKPSGLKVHPSSTNDTETLLNGLAFKLKDKLSGYGINLVNRIDRETSGLVVAAISPKGAWHFSRQFASGNVSKTYLAYIEGNWSSRFGKEPKRISRWQYYDKDQKRQVVDTNMHRGKHAETIVEFIEYDKKNDASLMKAKPVTGRTHQIRLHLEEQNAPIIGDTKYSGIPYDRLMLHASRLRLPGIDGKEIDVKSKQAFGFPK